MKTVFIKETAELKGQLIGNNNNGVNNNDPWALPTQWCRCSLTAHNFFPRKEVW